MIPLEPIFRETLISARPARAGRAIRHEQHLTQTNGQKFLPSNPLPFCPPDSNARRSGRERRLKFLF